MISRAPIFEDFKVFAQPPQIFGKSQELRNGSHSLLLQFSNYTYACSYVQSPLLPAFSFTANNKFPGVIGCMYMAMQD